MEIFLMAVLFFFALILYLLFMRIALFIDTDDNKYFISAGGVVRIVFLESGEWNKIGLKLPFYKKSIDMLNMPEKKKKEKKAGKESKVPKEKKNISLTIDDITDIFRIAADSLRRLSRKLIVKNLDLDFDTNNFYLNGNLIPILSYLSSEQINLNINFTGRRFLSTCFYFRIGTLLPIAVGTYLKIRKYIKN